MPKSCAELGICITNDDLLLIPEVIAKGEKTEKGKSSVYKLRKDGVTYTVLTEARRGAEEFCDFYSNKKGGNTSSQNTQLSAQDYDVTTNDVAKVEQNSDNAQNSVGNLDAEYSIKQPTDRIRSQGEMAQGQCRCDCIIVLCQAQSRVRECGTTFER